MESLAELLAIAPLRRLDAVRYVNPSELDFASLSPYSLSDTVTDWSTVPVLIVPAAYDGRIGYVDLVAVSNYQSLLRDYPDLVRSISWDGDYGLLAVLDLAWAEEQGIDLESADYLYRALVRLHDYPLYDDSDYSELELETEAECWDDYGRRDLRNDLSRAGYDSDELADEQLDSAVRSVMESGQVYVEFDGNGAYWVGLEDTDTLAAIASLLSSSQR